MVLPMMSQASLITSLIVFGKGDDVPAMITPSDFRNTSCVYGMCGTSKETPPLYWPDADEFSYDIDMETAFGPCWLVWWWWQHRYWLAVPPSISRGCWDQVLWSMVFNRHCRVRCVDLGHFGLRLRGGSPKI